MKLIKALSKRRTARSLSVQETETDATSTSGATGVNLAQTTVSMPNVFGGVNEYRNGSMVSSSRPNIFGGFDKTAFSLHDLNSGSFAQHAESALVDILGFHADADDEA